MSTPNADQKEAMLVDNNNDNLNSNAPLYMLGCPDLSGREARRKLFDAFTTRCRKLKKLKTGVFRFRGPHDVFRSGVYDDFRIIKGSEGTCELVAFSRHRLQLIDALQGLPGTINLRKWKPRPDGTPTNGYSFYMMNEHFMSLAVRVQDLFVGDDNIDVHVAAPFGTKAEDVAAVTMCKTNAALHMLQEKDYGDRCEQDLHLWNLSVDSSIDYVGPRVDSDDDDDDDTTVRVVRVDDNHEERIRALEEFALELEEKQLPQMKEAHENLSKRVSKNENSIRNLIHVPMQMSAIMKHLGVPDPVGENKDDDQVLNYECLAQRKQNSVKKPAMDSDGIIPEKSSLNDAEIDPLLNNSLRTQKKISAGKVVRSKKGKREALVKRMKSNHSKTKSNITNKPFRFKPKGEKLKIHPKDPSDAKNQSKKSSKRQWKRKVGDYS